MKADTLTKYLVSLSTAPLQLQEKSTADMIVEMCLHGYFDRNMAYELFDNFCIEGYVVLLRHYILEDDRISALDVFKDALKKNVKISDEDINDLTELCSKKGDVSALKTILLSLQTSKTDIPGGTLLRFIVPFIMLGESKFLIPFVVDFIKRTSLEADLARVNIAFNIAKFRRMLGACHGKAGKMDILSMESMEKAIIRSMDGKRGISRFTLRELCVEYASLLPIMESSSAIAPMGFHNFPFLLAGKLPFQLPSDDVDRKHRLIYSSVPFKDDFLRLRRQAEMNLMTHLERNTWHDLDTDIPVNFSRGAHQFKVVKNWLDRQLQNVLKDDDGYVAHCLMTKSTELDESFGVFDEDDDGMDEMVDDDIDDDVS